MSVEFLRVVAIVRPHGIHGAVKMEPLSDDLRRYKHLKDAYLEVKGEYTPITVSDVGVKDGAVYASLSCCASRDEAEKLRGAYVCVDRAHAVKLPPDVYFVTDLIGCMVEDDEGEAIGKLTDVYETGANDVYMISGKRKLLLPALKRVLKEVDVKNKRIVLDKAVLEEVGLFED